MTDQQPNYTFNKDTRYLTQGVNQEVPLLIQTLLWDLLDEEIKKGTVLDYLQVFDVSVKEGYLTIKHFQEEPPFEHLHRFPIKNLFEDSMKFHIYIIDDVDHSTLLLSSEY